MCHPKIKAKHFFYSALFILAAISISINIIFYLADVEFYLCAKKIIDTENEENKILTNPRTFKAELIKATYRIIHNGNRGEFPRTKLFFTERIEDKLKSFNKPKTPFFLWSEPSYMLACALNDAIKRKDANEITHIQEIFDKQISEIPLQITDQCPNGLTAIQLYNHFKQEKYKDYADAMYNWLKEQDTDFGILYRKNGNVQNVDVLGMVSPFLYLYANTFQCDSAQHLADKTIDQFIKYGSDKETGFSTFTFRINSPHIKMGMSNWGRGTAWYAIGLLYCNPMNLSNSSQQTIQLFNDNLKELFLKDKHFSQFIGEGGIDLSAELPLIYYMKRKGIYKPSTKEIMSYSQYMHNGIMYNSSSSNSGIIRYGVNNGPYGLSQAFMILLLNEIQ